jgi:glyoxylase-like metal-dependent hydrolase (beta-lactamase superfamily II)
MSGYPANNGRISCLEPPIQLSPRVWRLGTYHLAVFLVRGDRESLLFEVGISSTAPLVMAQLAGLGIDPKEIRYVVLTHSHSDHATGGAGLAASLPKADLVMSPASQRHLNKPETGQQFKDEDVFTTAAIMGLEAADQVAQSKQAPPLTEPLIKEPGDRLQMGSLEMELLGADGHVPGGLLGWLPDEGVLLTSDSAGYCSQGEPGYPLYFVSYTGYQANMLKLCQLRPEIVGLGHQDCFSGQGALHFMDWVMNHLDGEHKRIMRGLSAGRSEESLAQDIFDRYYHNELAVFPPDAIMECCGLLVRRSREHEEG